jgi:hypothetical protein
MEERKIALLKCGLRAFGAYAILSFIWVAVLSLGTAAASGSVSSEITSVNSSGISEFAERLVMANGAFALFAAVYGYSFLIFRIKNASSAAKRTLHILVNYIAAMICVYVVHSTAPNANATVWIVLLFFATLVFFAIYGIATFVSFMIKRNR